MIPLPNLPTDNLYKFIFIFGFFLIGLGSYLSYGNQDVIAKDYLTADSVYNKIIDTSKIKSTSLEYKRVSDSLQNNHKYLHDLSTIKDTNNLQKQISLIISNHNLTTSQGIYIVKHQAELYKKIESHYESEKKFDKRIESFVASANAYIAQRKKIDLVDEIAFWSRVVGVVMVILGGIAWYFNVQIIQDILLELQAAELKKKISEGKTYNPRAKYNAK